MPEPLKDYLPDETSTIGGVVFKRDALLLECILKGLESTQGYLHNGAIVAGSQRATLRAALTKGTVARPNAYKSRPRRKSINDEPYTK